jgi:hypothetical protein
MALSGLPGLGFDRAADHSAGYRIADCFEIAHPLTPDHDY